MPESQVETTRPVDSRAVLDDRMIEVKGDGSFRENHTEVDDVLSTLRVAVVMVTWNRKEMIARVLEDLAKQSFNPARFDVVVTDNASTDGTLEYLQNRFHPERVVENPTDEAHKPRFGLPGTTGQTNTLGFGSLSIIRNSHNHGGCGGFNTGFAFVDQVLDSEETPARPDFLWLVDDDVRMPRDTCKKLLTTAINDDSIGLVGTRTVHIDKPGETIETTIYFNPVTGLMDDHPPAGHRLEASHNQWAKQVGGPKGEHTYTGVREVDVVSACSMLARWSAVKRVGFWDWRYFIYCDDADWCMRFGKAGYKVVLNLDATVLHTPWHYKLTPARLYYAQRNVVWMMQKVLPPADLRRVVARRLYTLLRDSLKASSMRRRFHAEIIRRTAEDICTGKAGKLDCPIPAAEDIGCAMERENLLRGDREIAILCCDRRSLGWAKQVRSLIRQRAAKADVVSPRFVEIVRNDVPGAHDEPPAGVRRVVYDARRMSRLVRRPLELIVHRPDAAVVFEQVNDFPLPSGRYNIHLDPKTLGNDSIGACQIERDSWGLKLGFAWRWFITALRCGVHVQQLKPDRSTHRYGGIAQTTSPLLPSAPHQQRRSGDAR